MVARNTDCTDCRGAIDGNRHVILVGLCVLGVLLATFAMPASTATESQNSASAGGNSGNAGQQQSQNNGQGGGGGAPFPILFGLLSELLDDNGGGTQPPPQRLDSDCRVVAQDEVIPGQRLTVTVVHEREIVSGATVFFNGRRVGTTNASGKVTGRVPYDADLTVTVKLPGDASCLDTGDADATPRLVAAAGGLLLPVADGGTVATAALQSSGARRAKSARSNITEQIRVEGDVDIDYDRPVFPGQQLQVEATIEQHPFPNATVTLDGRRVGTTNPEGLFTLQIPDDGKQKVELRIQRGEIFGETTVELQRLTARIESQTLLAYPGAEAVVDAELGTDPANDAIVRVDGRRVAKTRANGRARMTMPGDPLATVTISKSGQTVTKAVWPLYATTGILVGFVLCLLVVGIVLYLPSVLAVVRAVLSTLLLGLLSLVTGLARGLSWLFTWLRRLAGQVPRSLSGLLAASLRVLRSLPWRIGRKLGSVLLWLRALPRRIWHWLRHRRGGNAPSDGRSAGSVPPMSGSGHQTLRELWRTFARWVVPTAWKQRTPAEVATLATDRGFPRGPVARLTTLFRRVEYGSESATESNRERARDAFDALSEHEADERDDEGGPNA